MLTKLWHKFSFLGVDVLSNDDLKIKTIISNQLSVVVCIISLMLIFLFRLFGYAPATLFVLALPVVMSLVVLILNAQGVSRFGGIILSLIIPLTLVLSQILIRLYTSLDSMKQGDYYRSSLWLIASMMIPILVIDSKRKKLQLVFVGFSFALIFLLNPIYQLLGYGMEEAGFDLDDLNLYNVISVLVGIVIVSGLLFLDNLNHYYKSKMIKMRDKLVESEKMASLGVLTAGLSHEINNPLNFIKGGAQIVLRELERESFDTKVVKESVQLVDRGVDRIANIVDSLRHFSKDKQGRVETCKVSEILEACISLIKSGHRDYVDVQSDFASDPMFVNGERNQLYHAFLSVLENAALAVSNDGVVHVSTKRVDESIMVVIEDNGHGIASADLPRVMEPFFTTRDPGEGIGMGLSIAYNIINSHQGAMKISSKLNVGTRVQITLPKQKSL
jgi:signal transduction histidine kinase